jgi:predicted PurR-regulated permease PerM
VVGPWVGLLTLSGFLAFGNHPGNVIPLVLYVGIFYVLKTAWLWPRMLPRQYDIHPLIFLIVLLVSLRLAGLFGVLLAFPLASCVGVLYDYLREHKSA